MEGKCDSMEHQNKPNLVKPNYGTILTKTENIDRLPKAKCNHKQFIKMRYVVLSLSSILLAVVMYGYARLFTQKSENEEIKCLEVLHDHNDHNQPFSVLNPVSDIHLYAFERPQESRPSKLFGKYHNGQVNTNQPLPTNQWYQNLFLLDNDALNDANRVYTIPYIIDTVGPIPGIRLFETRVLGMDKIVQVTYVNFHGLTLGATHNLESTKAHDETRNILPHHFSLDDDQPSIPLSPLGVTLKWKSTNTSSPFQKMSSSIVRGMPYGTMRYQYRKADGLFQGALPTVASELLPHSSSPLVDSKKKLICANATEEGSEELVTKSVTLSFPDSDYTWVVFYSHPVYVRCYEKEQFFLQVNRLMTRNLSQNHQDDVFVARIALLNNCTHGTNPSHCVGAKPNDNSEHSALLHEHANVYPGPSTKIDFTFIRSEHDNEETDSYLSFNWDARLMSDDKTGEYASKSNLLMFSLPHHREIFFSPSSLPAAPYDIKSCIPTINGPACLVKGSNWELKESLGGKPSFSAPRPLISKSIPNLARAIKEDIYFRLPEYFQRGAGDTYFSGKLLAKLSRILLITEELTNMCSEVKELGGKYYEECDNITLPSDEVFDEAVDHLRSSTEIWINGTADTPFVYDTQWGGIVSCGCHFNGASQRCDNVFPDCPAFFDRGLDFGHGFYNDHHYHQGYHIYAAATVAHFDPSWGIKHFEEVLLLIRDIANPSQDDVYFPTYRMKDWYLGNSWAAGIGALYPNGRNQESSSEAIAAYESISLFGQVMTEAWTQEQSISNIDRSDNILKARHIRDVGCLLTATELRSADNYWHVSHSNKKKRIYPKQYTPLVVGMLWNTMAQFQTWFGSAPHLAYGIQLLPLTPVAERRDTVEWAKELYPSFAQSCRSSGDCDAQGWGILQYAILATVGHPDIAIEYSEKLPKEVFQSAGGNGHSLTNTIWYYATRPKTEPLELVPEHYDQILDCGCPDTCTNTVLEYQAVGYTCGERIQWLIQNDSKSQREACIKVAGNEFADQCGECNPNKCVPKTPALEPTEDNQVCPKCSLDICEDKQLNRCPILDAPYICIDGASRSGCSAVPWQLGLFCNKCCKLTYDCK